MFRSACGGGGDSKGRILGTSSRGSGTGFDGSRCICLSVFSVPPVDSFHVCEIAVSEESVLMILKRKFVREFGAARVLA